MEGWVCSYILGLGLRSRLASALLGARLALSGLARLATAAAASALASLAIATAALISPSLSATAIVASAAVIASAAIVASLLIAALVHNGCLNHLADHIDVHNSAVNLSLIEILKKNQGASKDFNRIQKHSFVRH